MAVYHGSESGKVCACACVCNCGPRKHTVHGFRRSGVMAWFVIVNPTSRFDPRIIFRGWHNCHVIITGKKIGKHRRKELQFGSGTLAWTQHGHRALRWKEPKKSLVLTVRYVASGKKSYKWDTFKLLIRFVMSRRSQRTSSGTQACPPPLPQDSRRWFTEQYRPREFAGGRLSNGLASEKLPAGSFEGTLLHFR